jgi:hypothetical protein
VTLIVGRKGSFVVNVIVALAGPGAVGSSVTVYDVLGAVAADGATQAFVPGGTIVIAFARMAEQFVVVFVKPTFAMIGPN